MRETGYHSNAESFAEEFIEMLHHTDSSLLHTHGLSVTLGEYSIIFFTLEENEHGNDSLIQLARNRMDLFKPAVEATNFKELLISTHDMHDWLSQRGIMIGIEAGSWVGKLKLKLFKWFPFLFGV
jgi:hypothetical protein